LRVGQHEVLVGITPTQMTALAHWPEGSDQAAIQLAPAPTASHSSNGETHVA
jgi:flagellar biogenesis protein FliO